MNQRLPQATTYRERAEECRELAQIASEDMKPGLLRLAEAYEQLARDAETPPDRKIR
jgi:hypothetical protein